MSVPFISFPSDESNGSQSVLSLSRILSLGNLVGRSIETDGILIVDVTRIPSEKKEEIPKTTLSHILYHESRDGPSV